MKKNKQTAFAQFHLSNQLIMSKEEFIEIYFDQDYTYHEICKILFQSHSINISERQLWRISCKLGLKRKGYEEDDLEVIFAVMYDELDEDGSCSGYKTLWEWLRQVYGLNSKRETVQKALKIADPEGRRISNCLRSIKRLRSRKYSSPRPNFT